MLATGVAMVFCCAAGSSQNLRNACSRDVDAAKVDLGKKLFFDARLSADGSISCASCHVPAQAFADHRPVAVGVRGAAGTRNTPSLLDLDTNTGLFWDGRHGQLDSLALEPLFSAREHGLAGTDDLATRLQAEPGYEQAFACAFGRGDAVNADNASHALARYVLSLRTPPSLVDRYLFGNHEALDARERAGLELFQGRAGCSQCHGLATTHESNNPGFHNHGIGASAIRDNLSTLVNKALHLAPEDVGAALQSDPRIAALGRFLTTHDPADIGKFRVPSLRHVAATAPYMHDGSIATLREAVDHELYYSAADRGSGFSNEERDALVALLRAFGSGTADTAPPVAAP